MSIMGSIEVLVTPEELISQAEELKRLGNDMKSHFEQMAGIMNKTKNYWIGEAGNIHRERYEEQKENIDTMLKRLFEHADDLLQISGNYTSAETANIDRVQDLPTDIIS